MYCSVCKKEVGDGGFCRYCGNRLTAETAAHHLKPGTVLGGKYVIQDFIGEGGFGITYIGPQRRGFQRRFDHGAGQEGFL